MASYLGAAGALQPTTPGLLRIQGVKLDNTTVNQTFNLPGPNGAGQYAFSTFTPSAAFSSTPFQFIYIYGFACDASGSCSAFNTDRGQFAIDDLTLTPVPEPSQWLLTALGLAVVGGIARRRVAV